MHHALLIPEILFNIISHITVDEQRCIWPADYVKSSAPTLVALALTCRAFSEPALDALWKDTEGVEPLMRCAGMIPAPQYTMQRDKEYFIVPTKTQLSIMARYGHRVRSLNISMECWRPGYPAQLFLRIIAGSSGVLVPNLRSLEIDLPCKLLHMVPPLLGLRMQRFFICISDYEQDGENVHTVFEHLSLNCPSLESLTVLRSSDLFQNRDHNVPYILPMSRAIQKMPKLRVVNVPAITKDALVFLGGLPSVTEISFRLPTGSDFEDILGSSRNPVFFENVDDVEWEINEWQDVEVFARLWPRKLTSMTLRSEVKFDPSLLQVLCDSLHVREAFRNLQRIYLFENNTCQLSPSTIITLDTIRPLFYLSQLRVVSIDARTMNIGANGLVEIAEAWKCLEVLILNKMDGCMFDAAPMSQWITVPEVVSFVERRPSLKSLWIGVTLRTVDDDYDMDEASLRALVPRDSESRLVSLKLNYPRNEDHIRKTYSSSFGWLFSKLFPRLNPSYVPWILLSDTTEPSLQQTI